MPVDRTPLSVVVAAPADAPGVSALLEAGVGEARGGAPVRVILTHDGLAVLSTKWPERLATAGVDVALCSRSARERGLPPGNVTDGVRWSSLTTFLAEGSIGRLWSAFP